MDANKVDAPVTHDFWEGVRVEREYQRKRWGTVGDRNKTPADWFWLVGYLAGKALEAHLRGNHEKARHHTISTAAALSHWFDAVGVRRDPTRPSDLEISIGQSPVIDPGVARSMAGGDRDLSGDPPEGS